MSGEITETAPPSRMEQKEEMGSRVELMLGELALYLDGAKTSRERTIGGKGVSSVVAHLFRLPPSSVVTVPEIAKSVGYARQYTGKITNALEQFGFINYTGTKLRPNVPGVRLRIIAVNEELYEAVRLMPEWQQAVKLQSIEAHLGVGSEEAISASVDYYYKKLGLPDLSTPVKP